MGCGHFVLDSTLSVKNLVPLTGFWRVLDIRLNGTNVGEYGKLVASGDVSLNYGNLVPSAGFNPQPGQVFTIVEKTSPGAITDAPFGPEGTVTTLNGMPFRISYVGGDGNDVTLTATVPRLNVVRGNGHFQFSFTNQSSAVYEVLGATNVSLPVAQWSVLGLPTHLGGGLYQFTDLLATNHAQRFYLLRAQ